MLADVLHLERGLSTLSSLITFEGSEVASALGAACFRTIMTVLLETLVLLRLLSQQYGELVSQIIPRNFQ